MMRAVISVSVALLCACYSEAQFFTDSSQSMTNGQLSRGTDVQPPQTNVFSPPQPNSPFANNNGLAPALSNSPTNQNGLNLPSQSIFPINQNGFNSLTQSNFPTNQNDERSTTQSNPAGTQNDLNLPSQSIFPFNQNNIVSTTQSSLPLSQSSLNSPNQQSSESNQNGFNSITQSNFPSAQSDVSTTQSNLQSSQNGLNSPIQSNFPINQNVFNSPIQSNFQTNQNGAISPNQSFSQNITSTTPSNLQPTLNDFFSSSQSVLPTTQSNASSTAASGLSLTQNIFPPDKTIAQNGTFSQNQTNAPPTQANIPPIKSDPFSTSQINSRSALIGTQSDSQSSSASPTSASLSLMQFTLATMLAGQYSNEDQYQDEIIKKTPGPNKHSLINVSYIPVIISRLLPAVTMYYEQRVNNSLQPVRQAIYAFTQETPCTLRMTTYDIANPSRFSATPEGLQALEKLASSELQNRPACDAFWELTDTESFTSYLATDQCNFEVAGSGTVRPSGSRNLTCFGMNFTEIWRQVISNQIVGGSAAPYVFKKTGNIYPVPVGVFSSNSCFKVPCAANRNSQSLGPAWSEIKSELSYTKKDGLTQITNGV